MVIGDTPDVDLPLPYALAPTTPQQRFRFLPEPHEHVALRSGFGASRRTVAGRALPWSRAHGVSQRSMQRELLSSRGLNAATVQLARTYLDALGTTAPAPTAPNVDPAQQAAAEESMWSWYLEWGEIARVAITDRKLLRELGFLNYKRPISDEEVVEEPVLDVSSAG